MIYFVVKKRPQIALGMLAGFGFVLGVAICVGVFLMATCFAMLGSYN
jgi:hypothetical protein